MNKTAKERWPFLISVLYKKASIVNAPKDSYDIIDYKCFLLRDLYVKACRSNEENKKMCVIIANCALSRRQVDSLIGELRRLEEDERLLRKIDKAVNGKRKKR